jgi:lipopolysaccharide export system permease protein
VTRRGRLFLPTLTAHLVREVLRTFALMMVAFVAIFVMVDFFDRFDDFLKQGASAGTIALLFMHRIPLVVAQVMPVAVLAGALVGLGLLARNNEFVALRSCGVSLWQVTAPLAAVGFLIGVANFWWGDTVVPASARRSHEIWNRDVKKRNAPTGVFAGRDIWFHGKAGFYNINRVAPGRRILYGLTIYQLKRDDFRPTRVIEATTAAWNDGRWQFEGAHTMQIAADGIHSTAGLPANFTLPETLDDFGVIALEPEETSYDMLRKQIRNLRSKGVDASESLVDLNLKIATPFAAVVMILLAVPLATRGTRATSLPAAIGLGFAIGVSYFFVLGFSRALGQTGSLPPMVAAWTANAVFAVVAGYYQVSAD